METRSVKGTGQFTVNGDSHPIKANKIVLPGTTIHTGPDSETHLTFGKSLQLRVEAETELKLTEINGIPSASIAQPQAVFELAEGTVLGSAKKSHSTFQIRTTNGIVSVQEAYFRVRTDIGERGEAKTTALCARGTLIVFATVAGKNEIVEVPAGKQCVAQAGNVVVEPVAPAEIERVLSELVPMVVTLGN